MWTLSVTPTNTHITIKNLDYNINLNLDKNEPIDEVLGVK